MGKRVAVIVGHPAADSWCGALAESYAAAALAGGHEVRMVHLAQLDFDPSLHAGYRQIQALEPDLLAAQATEMVIGTPEAFRAVIADSLAKNAKVIKAIGLKAE